jgi:catechol 2,3-dioxygenase
MALQKLAHVEIRVQDPDRALTFYRDVMGLVPLGQSGSTHYFGCGLDENFDLAVTPGGTGVAHFAFQVDTEEDLAHYRQRLQQAGIQCEERQDSEPGVIRALRFTLPTGHVMELVLVKDRRPYLRPAAPALRERLAGVTPDDIDHVTLSVHAPQVRTLAEFLRDVLDFKISDIFQPAPDVWAAVWTRVGEWHHDLAMIGAPEPSWTLHHVAWTFESIDHIKRMLDRASATGIKVEYGLGRHALGSNLYAYLIEPGGNRFELTGEMPRAVEHASAPLIWTDFPEAASAWGVLPPESFGRGS